MQSRVSARFGEPQKAVTALVSNHLLVTARRLGTLLEAPEDDFPTVTAARGTAGDTRSEQPAMTALRSYAMAQLFGHYAFNVTRVLAAPRRLTPRLS